MNEVQTMRSNRLTETQAQAAGRIMKITRNADVPALFKQAAALDTSSARALLFMILTSARPGEVYSMRWCEVDFDARRWVVPAAHTKANQVRHIPFSRQALQLLGDEPRAPQWRSCFSIQQGRTTRKPGIL